VSSRRPTGPTPVNVRSLNDPRVIQEAQGTRREAAPLPVIDWAGVFGRRVGVLAIIFVCWVTGIEARLLYLQVLDHEDLMNRASRQQEDREVIPGARGDIVDRNGTVLAMSVRGHALMVARRLVTEPDELATRVCQALTRCDAAERRSIADTMRPVNGKASGYPFLRREVSPEEVKRLTALNEPALRIDEASHRYYPNGETAAHVLGFVNADNRGQTGIELAEEKRITGHPGRKIVQVTGGRPRTRLSSRILEEPTTGSTVELTIDARLQYMVEQELQAGVQENNAEGGTAVVMDPFTGDILALANYPTYNPNDVGVSALEARQNRAALNIYEPGSTFKVVTAAAAFQEAHMSPFRIIDVSAGQIRFGNHTIHDMHRYGPLTVTDVLVKSSNVGAIKIGLELGPEIISRYVSRFGFGESNALDIPHQRSGLVDRNMANFPDSALASVSMGYHVGVTALQMAAAVSSVANGGELVAPRLVRAVVADGQRTERPSKTIRRTITPETANTLTTVMEQVVSDRGTAKLGQIDGYTIAGKTGTAHKVVNGRYSPSEYNASFVAFMPSRNPRATVVVVIDTPRGNGYTGGVVAAPVFKRIAQATLRHLGVPHNVDAPPPVLVVRNNGDDKSSASLPAPTPVRSVATMRTALETAARDGVMPDVRGLSGREALRVLSTVGVEARISGDGFVATQSITPGTPLQSGQACTLVLRRQLIPIAGDIGTQQ
jgi:cell division protein FtsI (penicillin-binding protein 3)